MYNIAAADRDAEKYIDAFGKKYENADDLESANALVTSGSVIDPVMISGKFLFGVLDLGKDMTDIPYDMCSYSGIAVFRGDNADITIDAAKDFIENGNISSSINLPDVTLGPIDPKGARVSIVMHAIEQPILMAAMMFSHAEIKAIAGGTKGELSYALVALSGQISSVPKVDGVIKVRVIQDI